MSEEQLKPFIAKIQADSSQQEQLKAEGADPVAIAKKSEFMISADDLKTELEISDDVMEDAAGANAGTALWLALSLRGRRVCEGLANMDQ